MSLNQLLKDLEASDASNGAFYKELQALIKLDSKREENLAKIKTRIKKLDRLVKTNDTKGLNTEQVTKALESYKEDLKKIETILKQSFGLELSKALKPLGHKLTGQAPVLQAGLFTIELNFDSFKAVLWYGKQQEKLDSLPLDAGKVAQAIEKSLKSLGSNLEEAIFIAKLKRAYERARLDNETFVPINLVLPELAYLLQGETFYKEPIRNNYRSYSRADYSYDLFKFGRGALSEGLQLKVAVKQYTRKRQDFLWIPNNAQGEGAVYSHLLFKE